MDDINNLHQLVAAIQASPKYANISPEFISTIGKTELDKRKNLKSAIKETKNILHQVGGSYFVKTPQYQNWLDELKYAANSGNLDIIKKTCGSILKNHKSTNERLPTLDTFYPIVFSNLPEIKTIIDLACGLNPISFIWFINYSEINYHAWDIYLDLTKFLNVAFPLIGIKGVAECKDIFSANSFPEVDLAFVFKFLPIVEQIEKGSSRKLLEKIRAKFILVTFPIQSLGGKNKGMEKFYATFFSEIIKNSGWPTKELLIDNELAYLIQKDI